jgi:hypothetical protein
VRRPLAGVLLALLALLPLAGPVACGDDGPKGSESALDEALGYLPEDAPKVVAVSTDLDGGQWRELSGLTDRFGPLGGFIREGAKERLFTEKGIDFERDVEPIIGNDAVVGLPDPRAVHDDLRSQRTVAAIRVKDAAKAEEILNRLGKPAGESRGAKLYTSDALARFFKSGPGPRWVALKGDVAVSAPSRERLEAALDQRERDDRLTEDAFEEDLEDLPAENALVRGVVNFEAIREGNPRAADFEKLRWTAALKTVAFAAQAMNEGLVFDFNADTGEANLSEADLPIAAGDQSPGVIRREDEIAVSVRNFAQTIRFLEAARRAKGEGREYDEAKRRIARERGVDIDREIIDQLSGDTAASIGLDRSFASRTTLEDPERFKRSLDRAAPALPELLEGLTGRPAGRARPGPGKDLHTVEIKDKRYVFGVLDRVFVVATSADAAAQVASQSPTPVEDSQGSVVVAADGEQLANELLADSELVPEAGPFAGLVTGPVGDLTGWMRSDTEHVRGHFKLVVE